MKIDIILSGVGGQGIVSIAAAIGFAAVESKLNLKQSEVHGMSQRGGEIQSHLRISDKEVHSDLIQQGNADMIISVEPMESLKYLPWLSPEGWLITNTKPFINVPNYPNINLVIKEIESFPNHITLDADSIARKIGSARSANMVMLGAASPFIEIPYEKLENGIRRIFSRKGDKIIKQNLEAMKAGQEYTEKYKLEISKV